MASSCLDIFLVVHFHLSVGQITQIYQRNRVETPPAFPAHIICPHAPESNDEPVLVENAGVTAPRSRGVDLLYPCVLVKRIHLNGGERMTAVTTNNYSIVFIYDTGLALTGLWLPPLKSNLLTLDLIRDVFGLSLNY